MITITINSEKDKEKTIYMVPDYAEVTSWREASVDENTGNEKLTTRLVIDVACATGIVKKVERCEFYL